MSVFRDYALKRNLNTADVLKAVENVVRESEIKKYKYDKIKVHILQNGKIDIKRQLRIAREGEAAGSFDDDGYQLISMQHAAQISDSDVVEGNLVDEPMPDLSLLRFETGIAKRVLLAALNDLIRQKQYDDFVNRIGEIVTFSILRIENGHLILVVNNAETILYRNKLLKGEIYRTGEYIKVYIEDVVRVEHGPQIIVSRTHKNFVVQLFKQEIPEIYEGIVEVKDVTRYAGLRSKISVYSTDQSIDAVGACIGVRGVRIAPIVHELRNERIDVVYYSTDLTKYVINALGVKSIEKVLIDEDNKMIEIVVPEENVSVVIGRQGVNINLASSLVGYKITVMSNTEESKRRLGEFDVQTNSLVDALDIEKVMAQLLVLEGYTSMELLGKASVADLASIDGFDEDIAEELIARMSDYLCEHKTDESAIEEIEKDENEKDEDGENVEACIAIEKIHNVSENIIAMLKNNDILTVNALAELDTEELHDIIGDDLNEDDAGKIILEARGLLGWI